MKTQQAGLKSGFTPFGIWAFSIGTSIGWGSFIVTCNTYLQKSGILGTVFGLLIGMAVILVITWNLQHMIRTSPSAGGIYAYEKKVVGKDLGFIAFWFILLTYLAILWANMTSVPLFARFFLGDAFRFGFHYSIFGYEVWLGEALLSICTIGLVSLICLRSSRVPNAVMTVAASLFTAGFTVCAVIALFNHGSSFSYNPLYIEGSNAFAQIVRIAAISPWAFIGFENISHFSEEYSFPVKKVRGILIWSVVITTALYLFVSLLSISAYPPEYDSWLSYIRDMGNLDGIKAVPAFYAAYHYLGQAGVTVLMVSLFAVILTSLIGNLMALSRLLFAAGRDGEASSSLSRVNGNGAPAKAVLAVLSISVFIPFLGRTTIGWIVDITTIGATIIYGLISHAVYMEAKRNSLKVERYTGAAGVVLMVTFMILLLIPGLLPFNAMETESYVLFIVWSLLGLGYFRVLVSRNHHHEYARHFVVWLTFLVLILFASMMWVARVTENAAETAVHNIFEYHESHPTDDSDPEVREERVAFLNKQAEDIGRTNTLYSAVALGIFAVCIVVLLNNYRHTQRLGQRLTYAEESAKAARKIADLRESISAMMTNMPGLAFSKDAGTGVYLACNQAFAQYAHKESPEGVVGLTDAEIFDPVTARHFVEDDKMALSMDEPYVFFEDVPDAQGNQRQFRTTKLKYNDYTGRLCLLGMCQDVTDMIRMQRENASAKEAYEQALSTSLIYTHLAQSLAHSYTDLYYVNTETADFTEYVTDEKGGGLREARRGQDFFDKAKEDAAKQIYPDDAERVIKALDRNTLLGALERNRTFIMTYRLKGKNGPTYVSMRVTRMEDDDRYIVMGVSDIDEQIKDRRSAERAQEEHTAYARLNALSGEFICVYVVQPSDGSYREYSANEGFEAFSIPKDGKDFFGSTRENGRRFVNPDDLERFESMFTRENVMSVVEKGEVFAISYRLMISGKSTHVQLKAALVDEKDGRNLIVGLTNIDSYVRQEEEYAERLAHAQSIANIDALTKVQNRHAYLDAEEHLDRMIAEHVQNPFAIVIMDVNDLKVVNDTAGHKAGDQYLRDASRVISSIFANSPVFRVGGDEFVVIVQGEDYDNLDALLQKMDEYNGKASHEGGLVIACGMSRFDNDPCVAEVFERADQSMYDNKNFLKSGK